MSKNKNNQTNQSLGPQGTQVFELDDVNKMLAAEIAQEQSATASTPALIGISEKVSGERFILGKNKLEVGRRPNSDLVIDDASVSSMHAQIIADGENWKVLNLLSSNGTFVNGEKVSEKLITSGDRVKFANAEYVFTFVDDNVGKNENSYKKLVFMCLLVIALLGGLVYFLFSN